MPPLETMDRYQKAVCWPKVGDNAEGGPIVGGPMELDVRWEDIFRETVDPKGNTIAVTATLVVDLDLPEQSLYWKGSLLDWYNLNPVVVLTSTNLALAAADSLVSLADASRFSQGPFPYFAVIWPQGGRQGKIGVPQEVVKVTSSVPGTGGDLNITRGEQGSQARSWALGSNFGILPLGMPLVGLLQGIVSNTTPDLKNRNIRSTVGLVRFRDALPNLY